MTCTSGRRWWRGAAACALLVAGAWGQDESPDASFAARLDERIDVVWAGIKGRSVASYAWRDKQTFVKAYEEVVGEDAPTTDALADAIASARDRLDEHERDPHWQWRLRALIARMLHDHGATDEALVVMLTALEAYPDEDYREPNKQSSYQHLVNTAAGWIWSRQGVEEAERFAIERFAEDDPFHFFYADWWEKRYHDGVRIERLAPLLDAVEQVYSDRRRRDRKRREMYEEYADRLADRVVAREHRVDDRFPWYLVASRSLERTERRNLVIVLPGGDGQAVNYLPWLMGVARQMHDEHVFAVLSAPRWSEAQAAAVTWASGWWLKTFEEAEVSTEYLIHEVWKDARKLGAFRVGKTFVWGWSSSGPAVYSAATEKHADYDGFYINSSVFRPERLDYAWVRNRRFYLQQGKKDTLTPPRHAEQAAEALRFNGAKVTLHLIDGGHGFGRDPYANVRAALSWLDGGR